MLYADHAASAPVRAEVREAVAPYLWGGWGNPSSRHQAGLQARDALEDARSRVATVLGFRSTEVIFTSGGSEANNLALKGIALAGLDAGRRRCVISPIEHESLRACGPYLAHFHGIEVDVPAVDDVGLITPAALAAVLHDDTSVVAIGHANNEIGTLQDIPALAAVAASVGARLHVDAVQSAPWIDLGALGADSLTIAGHKLGAPRGIGALGVRSRVALEPLIHGGGQENDRRAGTENVAGAVGLAVALECAAAERDSVGVAVAAFTEQFIAAVLATIPGASLTGPKRERLPGLASFTLAETGGEAVLIELERRGILASSGSACAVGSTEPSAVLLACGIPEERAHTAVRFSFGTETPGTVSPQDLAAQVRDAVAAVAA